MKYVVQVQGTRHVVDLSDDGVTLDGVPVDAALVPVPGSPVLQLRDGTAMHRIIARRTGQRGNLSILHRGHRYAVEALDERTRAIRDLTNATVGASGPAPMVAPMPGMIVRIGVSVGDTVAAGQGLIVMEAMKMENELRATAAGTVSAIRVTTGTAVQKGDVLIELS